MVVDLGDGLKLLVGMCSFVVEFVVLDYIDFVKLCYMMWLEGWDIEWIFIDVSVCFVIYGGL